MALQGFITVLLFLCCGCLSFAEKTENISTFGFGRSSFPPNFIFGAASSAYQYEGGPLANGRGESIWDVFTRKYQNKIADQSNASVAEDFYYRYKEDIKLMESIGLDSFRLSISWPRVIPSGKLRKGVNKKGIEFYNNVINELLAKGIEPLITIFHWDLPQPLEEEYGGFLSPNITKDYVDFAELCFKEFGDRVKLWTTFNEPSVFSLVGYDLGLNAPGRCSSWRNNACPGGDSGTEPYIVSHNVLISHAAIVKLYRQKYKPHQRGEIGIVLATTGYVPLSRRKADIEATNRALEFFYGWFADPLVFGDYPESMRRLVGERLPKFSAEESKLVKGSFDFLGLNYYSSSFAANTNTSVGSNISYSTDSQVLQTNFRNGKPIGAQEGNTSNYAYPKGLLDILVYTKARYSNPTVYITENGLTETGIRTVEEGVKDFQRVNFYKMHLKYLKEAIDLGVNVKGFFPWSFLDTWEWSLGFTQRLGLVFIDYQNGLERHPKLSALFYKKFLAS